MASSTVFYGPVHIDPVFQVTAITTRRDVLHDRAAQRALSQPHQFRQPRLAPRRGGDLAGVARARHRTGRGLTRFRPRTAASAPVSRFKQTRPGEARAALVERSSSSQREPTHIDARA